MLKDLVKSLRKLSPVVMQAEILKVLKTNQRTLVRMNTEQLMEGKDAEGGLLEPYKSNSYAERKLKLNPLGVTDLKLTGKFHGGFFVNVDKFPAYVFSRDDKTRKLVGQYGSDIFGLDEENQGAVNETLVLPKVQSVVRKAIHL